MPLRLYRIVSIFGSLDEFSRCAERTCDDLVLFVGAHHPMAMVSAAYCCCRRPSQNMVSPCCGGMLTFQPVVGVRAIKTNTVSRKINAYFPPMKSSSFLLTMRGQWPNNYGMLNISMPSLPYPQINSQQSIRDVGLSWHLFSLPCHTKHFHHAPA